MQGKELQSARRAKGLTQKELAEMVGCTIQAIKHIENDRRKPLAITAKAIQTALNN